LESRAHYALVGALVVFLTVLIVVAILWLSEAGSLRRAKYFSIYFQKHALNGLQVDSNVTMRGIKVGSVVSLEISSKNIEKIHVVILVDGDTPVKTNTVAILNRNLLTGFAALDLAKGTQNAPLLVDKADEEPHPVIPEGNTELEELANSIPELLEQVSEMSTRVRGILSEANVQAFNNSLKNIESFTSVLAGNKSQFDSMLKKIELAAEDVAKVSKSLNEFTTGKDGKLNALSDELLETVKEMRSTITAFKDDATVLMKSVSGTSQMLSQNMALIAQSLREATETTVTTLEDYQKPRKILSGPSKGALGPGEGGFGR